MILKLFLFWRIGLFVITFLGSNLLAVSSNGGLGSPTLTKSFNYWYSWAQWDGGYFYAIAQRGYQHFSDYAFFPVYPVLIRVLDNILPSGTLITGLIVSNVSFLLFMTVFYKFVKEKYSKETAFNALVTFLFFPTTFFAIAVYSESLFLLFTSLAFFALYKKRLLLASIAISFASLTRLVGIVLSVSLFYNYFASINFDLKKVSSKILLLCVSLFGFISYGIYLFSRLNDPFKFVSLQSLWERSTNDPISTIISSLWNISVNSAPPDQYLDFFVTLLFLVVLILGIKKISSSLWIFSILVILIPASSGTLTSMPRYALGSLGVFVIIGDFLKDHPNLRIPVWGAALFLQAFLASRFINGYWVA